MSFNKVEEIEKISTDIMWISSLQLKHTVKLGSSRDDSRIREGYHKEFRYESSQYNNKRNLTNIKITMASYMTLENKEIDKMKQPYISQKNIYRLIKTLDTVIEWFYKIYQLKNSKGEIYNTELFLNDDSGRLILNRNVSTKIVIELGSAIVEMSPAVIDRDGELYEGVRWTINGEHNFYIDLDDVECFRHFIGSCNLYSMGVSLLNYIGCPDVLNEDYVVTFSRGEFGNETNTHVTNDGIKLGKGRRQIGSSENNESNTMI